MTEYLTMVCECIEGQEVRLVLKLPDPVDYRVATIGLLTVFIGERSYAGQLSRESLNRQVIWDEKYMESLRSIFRSVHKAYTLSAIERANTCTLELKSEITKGIKIVLLHLALPRQKEQAFQCMVELFGNMCADKQTERTGLQTELKRISLRNETIDREQQQLLRNVAKHEQDLKANFLREINDVKLKIRRKWPDLNRKSLHDLKQSPQPAVVAQQKPAHDQLLDIFK